MPFIAVSFGNDDHITALHEKAQSTLADTDAEISCISRLLCISSPSLSRKGVHYLFQWMHKIYFLLLGVLLIIALVSIILHQSSIFLVIYLSSLIDLGLLLWWNQSSVHRRFAVCLLEATSGVGLVKRRKWIGNTQKFTFTILMVLAVVYMIVFISSSLLQSEVSLPFGPLVSLSLQSVALSMGLISTVAGTTLFTTRFSLISSEFYNHSDDFRTDGNTFQVCVTKHYVTIHSKIIKVFIKLRNALSIWLFLHIIIDFIHFHIFLNNLIPILDSSRSLPSDPLLLILLISRDLLLPLFIPLTRLILSFASVHRLQIASSLFTNQLVSHLCTENKMMNDQTYLLCITYSSHVNSSCSTHLHLFGWLLDSSCLVKISLCALLLLYLTHFRPI